MKHLVVARYREDTSWIEHVPLDWHVLVVQKEVDLPNEGREASSYFYALAKLYPTLQADDLVACVQGNPLKHCPDLYDELRDGARAFRYIGNWHVYTDGVGGPHHPGLPVRQCHEEWVGPYKVKTIPFIAGGQFIVTGREVLAKPKAVYELMIEKMGGDGPWVMERLWEPFFTNTKGTTWQ